MIITAEYYISVKNVDDFPHHKYVKLVPVL